jgi:hypothetical protein
MARLPRLKEMSGGWYHLHARVAAYEGEYPLQRGGCQQQLIWLLKHFSAAYCCAVGGFCVMGNHWHTVLRFMGRKKLSREELYRRARLLYGGRWGEELLAGWGDAEWERFNERIYDVSELMRNVQAAFARWYNRTFGRKGRFWGERFGSTLLKGVAAILKSLLYVELNAVRAGLAENPGRYEGGSLYLREIGEGGWLLPLGELLRARSEKKALREYRALLYYVGREPGRKGGGWIPERVLRAEERRGFKVRGAFARRVAYFTRGLVVGTASYVRRKSEELRSGGWLVRRREPTSQGGGTHFSLRCG